MLSSLELQENVDLKKMNTLGIGGIAKYYYLPKSKDELLESIKLFDKENIKYFVIGGGSNVILPDEDFDGVVIGLRFLKKIKIVGDEATIDAGVMICFMNNAILKKGYTSFVWASGIPGTIGGTVYNNAGAYGHDMFESLVSVEVIDNGNIREIPKSEIDYGYRYTSLKGMVILSATFNIYKGDMFKAIEEIKVCTEKRISNQPLDFKNAGSTFRNPDGDYAGRLIEEAGLKGYSVNGASVSLVHANFIVSDGTASSEDVLQVIKKVQSDVSLKFNVDLVLENEVISW